MPDNPPRGARRPWSVIVAAVAVIFLILLALAMLSEREDAQVLPAGELEGVEEPFESEPGRVP